jgi:hypothetical protein
LKETAGNRLHAADRNQLEPFVRIRPEITALSVSVRFVGTDSPSPNVELSVYSGRHFATQRGLPITQIGQTVRGVILLSGGKRLVHAVCVVWVGEPAWLAAVTSTTLQSIAATESGLAIIDCLLTRVRRSWPAATGFGQDPSRPASPERSPCWAATLIDRGLLRATALISVNCNEKDPRPSRYEARSIFRLKLCLPMGRLDGGIGLRFPRDRGDRNRAANINAG